MSINQELSDLFAEMAQIMEIKGENTFKCLAFSKVSRVLKDTTVDIKEAVEKKTLAEIDGIGKSSLKIIEDIVTTGKSADYIDLKASVPGGLPPLLAINGLGPKTISLFWKEKGITNLEELKKALADGSLDGLKGIGAKKLDSIKQGIEFLSRSAGRLGIGDVQPIALGILEKVRALKEVEQAEIAGSYRRGRETIGDVDILCTLKKSSKGTEVTSAFTKFSEVHQILGEGTTKSSILTKDGLQVDLRVVPTESFGAALMYFTGSKDHNIKLRSRAIEKGMILNEWGLYKSSEYDKADKKPGQAPEAKAVASKSEADVYKHLDLKFIAPELREDRGEIDAADNNQLPNLINRKDINGDLHCHTTASDGAATIEQMVEKAIALGYEYLAITDHSKSQPIANGLSIERLLAHIKAIHKAAEKYKNITLLAGCEVDILSDGEMDYEDAILAELDFVVASPHAALKQDSKTATDRIVRAINNRYVNIIGHPTGRLINRREGLPLDFGPIYKAASETGTALEINSGYPRLDLNDTHARAAIAAGCKLAIDTDAHSIEMLDEIDLGITVARRAWVTPAHVINCWSYAELTKFITAKRQ